MPYGVAAARFGGLTMEDVINAWPLSRLEEFLRKDRSSLLNYMSSSSVPSSAITESRSSVSPGSS